MTPEEILHAISELTDQSGSSVTISRQVSLFKGKQPFVLRWSPAFYAPVQAFKGGKNNPSGAFRAALKAKRKTDRESTE